MSTTPSKPLDFVAQIGVLGKGSCKPNLRCPPHVTVPFPAVFYSFAAGQGKNASADAQPSPYVGLIDLENSLQRPERRDGSRKRRRHQMVGSDHDSRPNSRTRPEDGAPDAQRRRRQQRLKQRSQSPKEPSGGCYRIPQQGQLQIVIKNPNKTAVKLFLVPYDLSDMEPGQKTFIRQRSYSAGPIIDMPISSRTNYGTDRPEAALCASDDPQDRPMLRYLIHLHICCPSKGRCYLYKSIRVVFANRVPDGKEKLRNEIQMPEPKYSVYKSGRDSNAGLPVTDVTPRRSSAVQALFDPYLDGDTNSPPGPYQHNRRDALAKSFPFSQGFKFPPVQRTDPSPYTCSRLPTLESRPTSRDQNDGMEIDEQQFEEKRSSVSPLSPTPFKKPCRLNHVRSESDNLHGETLSFSRESSRERVIHSESLIARRLKDLEMRSQNAGSGA
ncbi:hypothetical protein H2203_006854 [Taxawa tesnikishii (nom. ined.)]|nr:hypothetical protein H2203_006854 [Dothideales sp. JES 119]